MLEKGVTMYIRFRIKVIFEASWKEHKGEKSFQFRLHWDFPRTVFFEGIHHLTQTIKKIDRVKCGSISETNTIVFFKMIFGEKKSKTLVINSFEGNCYIVMWNLCVCNGNNCTWRQSIPPPPSTQISDFRWSTIVSHSIASAKGGEKIISFLRHIRKCYCCCISTEIKIS